MISCRGFYNNFFRLNRVVEPPPLNITSSIGLKLASLSKATQTYLLLDDEPEGDLAQPREGKQAKFSDGDRIPEQV